MSSSIQTNLNNGVEAKQISKKAEYRVRGGCEITVCLGEHITLVHFLRET